MVKQFLQRDQVSRSKPVFAGCQRLGWELGPFEGPPTLKPPALPGDTYLNLETAVGT